MARHVVRESGRSVNAAVGDEIVVMLPECATAGYQWHVADGLPPCLVEYPESQPTVNHTEIGSDALRAIGLRVTGTGTHLVRLLHYRPWEGPEKSSSSFTVEIMA